MCQELAARGRGGLTRFRKVKSNLCLSSCENLHMTTDAPWPKIRIFCDHFPAAMIGRALEALLNRRRSAPAAPKRPAAAEQCDSDSDLETLLDREMGASNFKLPLE